MKYQRFEDLEIWKKSKDLVLITYRVSKSIKDFEFKNQITSCALSVMNNIAEGFERSTEKDYRHFLYISKGSAGEFRSMIYIGKELSYISEASMRHLIDKSEEISKMLAGYIKALS
jgi:four helix bundle protein